jgi:hypothetical protein
MKINLAIDCTPDSIPNTLVALHSFLDKNPWFDGKVYILSPNANTFTKSNLSDLSAIYENHEVISCSIDPRFTKLLSDSAYNPNTISRILSIYSLVLPEEKLLFISNSCLVLRNLCDLLTLHDITLPSNSVDDFRIDLMYRPRRISQEKLTEEFISHSSLTNSPVLQLLSNFVDPFISEVTGLNSLEFNDKVWIKRKTLVNSLHFLRYDTLKRNGSAASKINQLWLYQQNIISKSLKRPSFRNNQTLIKTPSSIISSNPSSRTGTVPNRVPTPVKNQRPVGSQPIKNKLISLSQLKVSLLNKSICLVANSSDLLNNSYGELIDSHDCVVRFNSFEISPEHTGTKTDIHASIYLESANRDIPVEHRIVISINKNNWNNIVNSLDPANQKSVVDVNWPMSISPVPSQYRSNKIPTTGFNLIMLFYEHISYSKISLVGFNFYKEGIASIYRKPGIPKNIAKIHNYSFEKRWVNSVFSEKNNILVHEKNSSL